MRCNVAQTGENEDVQARGSISKPRLVSAKFSFLEKQKCLKPPCNGATRKESKKLEYPHCFATDDYNLKPPMYVVKRRPFVVCFFFCKQGGDFCGRKQQKCDGFSHVRIEKKCSDGANSSPGCKNYSWEYKTMHGKSKM